MGCSSSEDGRSTYSKVQTKNVSETPSDVRNNDAQPAHNPSSPDPKDFKVAPVEDAPPAQLADSSPTSATPATALLPKDPELGEVEEEPLDSPQPWGRFMALWVCCTLASGILPGQALFVNQCAAKRVPARINFSLSLRSLALDRAWHTGFQLQSACSMTATEPWLLAPGGLSFVL